MNRPGEKQLNNHLCQAVSAIPSDHAEELWNTPVEKADSDAWFLEGTGTEFLEGTNTKQTKPLRCMRWTGLAAACFAILFLGWFRIFRVPDATVYLDVNPGVTLDVNRLGRVVRAEADNEDGRIILDDMDLRNTDADAAMNALLGSMVRHGYLSRTQNTLLLSVNGKNEARAAVLRQKLSESAGQTLETLLGDGIILAQTVDPDNAAKDIAEHYGITPGKAALIIRLLKDQPSWNVQDLAAMPMSELIRYCHASGIDISQYLGEDGEVIGDVSSLLDVDNAHAVDDAHDAWDDQNGKNDHSNRNDRDDRDDDNDRNDPDDKDDDDDTIDPDDKDDDDDRDDSDDKDDVGDTDGSDEKDDSREDHDEEDRSGTVSSREESDDDDDGGEITDHHDEDEDDDSDEDDDHDDESDSDEDDDDEDEED